MEIILNPTNECDFNCEFCAAHDLPKRSIPISSIHRILDPYVKNMDGLIINGGDPLNMKVEWYEALLEYMDKKCKKDCFLSLTTNLYQFYRFPYVWKDILSNPRVGVITSFQYGNKRRLSDGRVFSENMFRKYIDMFNYVIGYKPDFIAVVDKDNERFSVSTVQLAKSLGVHCKLNQSMKFGCQDQYYPRYKMYEQYIKIIDAGLIEYEDNCKLLQQYFTGKTTWCPIAMDCKKHIRAINADGKVYPCGFLANVPMNTKTKIKASLVKQTITDECMYCENYKLCNSCHRITEEVIAENDCENYCKNMKVLIPELKRRLTK